MNNDRLYLPQERYIAVLNRQRDRIAKGIPLVLDDSDEIGNKHTSATWGLCSEEVEAWPDAEDHLWPDDFNKHKRVAPKYQRENQMCPFDAREKPTGNGCFYTCRLFRGRYPTPNRDEALALYDQRIAQHQEIGA